MLSLRIGTCVLFIISLAAPVAAQNASYQLSLEGPATAGGGQTITASIRLDNNGSGIAGWSYGVCHDPAILSLGTIAEGATTLVVKNGSPPDFSNTNTYPNGFTKGVVICFAACATLAPGTLDAELARADYTALVSPIEPEPAVTTSVDFCTTLGVPPIPVVLTVSSNSIVPVQTSLSLSIEPEPLINPNYTLHLSGPALVGTAEAVDVAVLLDNAGQDVAGWSFGVCHDGATLGLDAVTDGATTQTARNGSPADFVDHTMHAGGFTSGVVICFAACAFLPPGTIDAELAVGHFTALAAPAVGDPPIDSSLAFCDTLGTPEIRTVLAVGGNSIVPTQAGSTVSIEGQAPTSFEYRVDPMNFRYFVPSAPVATPLQARIRIAQIGNDPAIPTQGFAMGLSHDPSMLTVVGVQQGDALLALGPAGPEFIETAIHPSGWTAAVVYSISSVLTMAFEPSQQVLRIDYSTVPSGFAGLTAPQNLPLVWSDSLGAPPVTNVVVISDGSGDLPNLIDGTIPMVPQFSGGFIRGDTNGDGQVQFTDVVWQLADLFQAGPTTRDICFAANDVNHDGVIHLADPVYLLNHIFAAGTPPSAPYPECGVTTIPDCQLPGFCAP